MQVQEIFSNFRISLPPLTMLIKDAHSRYFTIVEKEKNLERRTKRDKKGKGEG
jgi:hypothetical protein